MNIHMAELCARSPGFYAALYCSGCNNHYPVWPNSQFVWVNDDDTETDQKVGT